MLLTRAHTHALHGTVSEPLVNPQTDIVRQLQIDDFSLTRRQDVVSLPPIVTKLFADHEYLHAANAAPHKPNMLERMAAPVGHFIQGATEMIQSYVDELTDNRFNQTIADKTTRNSFSSDAKQHLNSILSRNRHLDTLMLRSLVEALQHIARHPEHAAQMHHILTEHADMFDLSVAYTKNGLRVTTRSETTSQSNIGSTLSQLIVCSEPSVPAEPSTQNFVDEFVHMVRTALHDRNMSDLEIAEMIFSGFSDENDRINYFQFLWEKVFIQLSTSEAGRLLSACKDTNDLKLFVVTVLSLPVFHGANREEQLQATRLISILAQLPLSGEPNADVSLCLDVFLHALLGDEQWRDAGIALLGLSQIWSDQQTGQRFITAYGSVKKPTWNELLQVLLKHQLIDPNKTSSSAYQILEALEKLHVGDIETQLNALETLDSLIDRKTTPYEIRERIAAELIDFRKTPRHGCFIPAFSSLFAKLFNAFLDEELNAQIASLQIQPLNRNEVLAIYKSGGILANQDLRGLDLSGLDLKNVDLSGANLDGANLTKTHLDNAILSNASLIKSVLFHAILWGDAQYDGTDFSLADLRCANLKVDKLQSAKLLNTQFTLSVHHYSWNRRNRYEYHRRGSTWVRSRHYISDIRISDIAVLQKYLEQPKGMITRHYHLNVFSYDAYPKSFAAAVLREEINSSIGHTEISNPNYLHRGGGV